MTDYLTTAEAAELLGVRASTVGQYVSQGKLQRAPEGITRRSVERWQQRQATAYQRSYPPPLEPRRWAVDE